MGELLNTPEISLVHTRLERREWLLHALATLGVLAAAPASLAQDHDSHRAKTAETDLASPSWQPAVLSADENSTLIALSDQIVPGASTAYCNRVIDLLLTVESEDNRNQLRSALAAFDKQAQTEFAKSFAALPSGAQIEILHAASVAESPLYRHFELAKEWIADVYWSSQQGLRDLGWKGRMAWSSFPGCSHAGVHS